MRVILTFLLLNSAEVEGEDEGTRQGLQLTFGMGVEEHGDGEAFGQDRVSVSAGVRHLWIWQQEGGRWDRSLGKANLLQL